MAEEAELGPFSREVARQVRAHDSYGVSEGKSDRELLAGFLTDKAPPIGNPDARALARLDQFYAAVALLIEKTAGLMASPVLQLSPEGFGRVVLVCGRLVVASKTLRDVHRFGFPTLARMESEGGALVNAALRWIERFPQAARAE